MPSSLLAPDDYFPLVEARHCDPFRVLGIRSIKGGFLARVLRPDAAEATVILDSKEAKTQKLVRVDEHGLFEGEIKGFSEGMSYTLHLTGHDGKQWRERMPTPSDQSSVRWIFTSSMKAHTTMSTRSSAHM